MMIPNLISPLVSAGNVPTTKTVALKKSQKKEADYGGHRVPARRIYCTIDQENGIIIPTIDKTDISSIDVYDECGYLIESFYDEMEFVSFVFAYSGNFEFYLNLDDCSLVGYVSL